MLSLMAGELAVYVLSGHVVIVPAPFGMGTTVFKEMYDTTRNRPKRDHYIEDSIAS